MSHPLGDLLSQHLHRKHGLSQSKLAEGILQAPSIISEMSQGRRLNGPQARKRVTAIAAWLQQHSALTSLDEANALLNAAGMSPLQERLPDEARLIRALSPQPARQPSPDPQSRPSHSPTPPPRHNLPTQLIPFVGRAEQIAFLEQQLQSHRLLTLTGSGGVGKTRLAVEVASRARARFADGVWFVDLASLTDPHALPQRILNIWRVPEQPERSALETLLVYLSAKESLLILDNCEHLIGACAGLAETILQHCPQIVLLATSREALNLPVELPWRVPSLTRPQVNPGWRDPAAPPQLQLSPEALSRFEAVALFVARARARQPDFALTAANAADVAHICSRLDGIPLALEMAAARVNVFTVEEMAVRLDGAFDGRFQLLAGGARTAPLRHQTLRATLEWSYSLLAPAEQELLVRLSVFTGGWTAAAAEAVADAPLERLAQLVNKSLVIAEQQAGQTRYYLLETVRQFAAEQAMTDREMQRQVQRRHSSTYLRLLAVQEEPLQSPQQKKALEVIRADFANIRAAWQWAVEQGEFTLLAPAIHVLFLYCEVCGSYREGTSLLAAAATELTTARASGQNLHHILAQVLGRIGACDVMLNNGGDAISALQQGLCYATTDQERAFALAHLGHAEIRRGEIALGLKKVNESLALSRQWGDLKGEARARQVRIWYFPDFTEAIRHCEESLAVWRQVGRPDRIAEVLSQLAWHICCRGDYEIANAYWEESLTVARLYGMQNSIAWTLDCQGWAAWCKGDLATAEKDVRNAAALYHAIGMFSGVAMCQAELALILRSAGELSRAVAPAREAVALARNTGDQMLLALCLNYLGSALIGSGSVAEARTALSEAIRQVLPTQHIAFLLNTFYYFAELLILESRVGELPGAVEHLSLALALLGCVRAQPATWQIYKEKAAQLLGEIEGALPTDLHLAAIARGQTTTLEEMVTAMLGAVGAGSSPS